MSLLERLQLLAQSLPVRTRLVALRDGLLSRTLGPEQFVPCFEDGVLQPALTERSPESGGGEAWAEAEAPRLAGGNRPLNRVEFRLKLLARLARAHQLTLNCRGVGGHAVAERACRRRSTLGVVVKVERPLGAAAIQAEWLLAEGNKHGGIQRSTPAWRTGAGGERGLQPVWRASCAVVLLLRHG
eukprot:4249087-Prymnesium_polylepis.1